MVVYIINPVAMETDTANWIASLVYFVSARPELTGVWDKKQGWPLASTFTYNRHAHEFAHTSMPVYRWTFMHAHIQTNPKIISLNNC